LLFERFTDPAKTPVNGGADSDFGQVFEKWIFHSFVLFQRGWKGVRFGELHNAAAGANSFGSSVLKARDTFRLFENFSRGFPSLHPNH
jgi:hypothetical protein